MKKSFQIPKEKLTFSPVLAFPDFHALCIMGTDASSIAFGAVLAQKKEDGKIRPIQFARMTTNSAESNYLPCEREAIALFMPLRSPGCT